MGVILTTYSSVLGAHPPSIFPAGGDDHKPPGECFLFITNLRYLELLLMEEILHHLECINLVNNGINHLRIGAGFIPSTVWIFKRASYESTVSTNVWKYIYMVPLPLCLHHIQMHACTIYRSLTQSLCFKQCHIRMRLISLWDAYMASPWIFCAQRSSRENASGAILSLYSI